MFSYFFDPAKIDSAISSSSIYTELCDYMNTQSLNFSTSRTEEEQAASQNSHPFLPYSFQVALRNKLNRGFVQKHALANWLSSKLQNIQSKKEAIKCLKIAAHILQEIQDDQYKNECCENILTINNLIASTLSACEAILNNLNPCRLYSPLPNDPNNTCCALKQIIFDLFRFLKPQKEIIEIEEDSELESADEDSSEDLFDEEQQGNNKYQILLSQLCLYWQGDFREYCEIYIDRTNIQKCILASIIKNKIEKLNWDDESLEFILCAAYYINMDIESSKWINFSSKEVRYVTKLEGICNATNEILIKYTGFIENDYAMTKGFIQKYKDETSTDIFLPEASHSNKYFKSTLSKYIVALMKLRLEYLDQQRQQLACQTTTTTTTTTFKRRRGGC